MQIQALGLDVPVSPEHRRVLQPNGAGMWSSLEAQVQEGWHLLFLSEPGDGLVVTREKSTA